MSLMTKSRLLRWTSHRKYHIYIAVNLTIREFKGVKLEVGALGKSARSALRNPQSAGSLWLGGVTDATRTVTNSQGCF